MVGEWREYRVGEIADIVGGSTPSTGDPSNFEGYIPWKVVSLKLCRKRK
jgi:type I restriction enzyme S subunit